jgi:hypothetical protein
MRQALHIFAKDVRCLWYEIAIVLIIAALLPPTTRTCSASRIRPLS